MLQSEKKNPHTHRCDFHFVNMFTMKKTLSSEAKQEN